MKVPTSVLLDKNFAAEFIDRLNLIDDVSGTSNRKFDPVREWLAEKLGRSTVASYLSGLRQFNARVGASLMGFAEVIVLLSADSWSTAQREGAPYVDRLEKVAGYTSGLDAIIACVGVEGAWSVEYVVGPHDSEVRRELAMAFRDAQDRPVVPLPSAHRSQPPPPPHRTGDLTELAAELYLPVEILRDIDWLLRDKKALVLYGPPGTGKTFIARKIAEWLQPHEAVRRLVQMHPSYGYEEFFEGYRPVGDSQGIALAKRDGPLRVLARNALAWPGHSVVLVLDEMNRANLPRVFGELFYRVQPVPDHDAA